MISALLLYILANLCNSHEFCVLIELSISLAQAVLLFKTIVLAINCYLCALTLAGQEAPVRMLIKYQFVLVNAEQEAEYCKLTEWTCVIAVVFTCPSFLVEVVWGDKRGQQCRGRE